MTRPALRLLLREPGRSLLPSRERRAGEVEGRAMKRRRNLRGDFGVLDSNRADVPYEEHKGHKLDRRMLELLRSS